MLANINRGKNKPPYPLKDFMPRYGASTQKYRNGPKTPQATRAMFAFMTKQVGGDYQKVSA